MGINIVKAWYIFGKQLLQQQHFTHRYQRQLYCLQYLHLSTGRSKSQRASLAVFIKLMYRSAIEGTCHTDILSGQPGNTSSEADTF